MQAVNMRNDDVIFDLEDRLLRVVRRIVLPAQSPTVEVSLVGVARIRNTGPSEVTIRVNTRGSLVILRPNETLLVEPDLMALIVVR